jgi:hypothetical protein
LPILGLGSSTSIFCFCLALYQVAYGAVSIESYILELLGHFFHFILVLNLDFCLGIIFFFFLFQSFFDFFSLEQSTIFFAQIQRTSVDVFDQRKVALLKDPRNYQLYFLCVVEYSLVDAFVRANSTVVTDGHPSIFFSLNQNWSSALAMACVYHVLN